MAKKNILTDPVRTAKRAKKFASADTSRPMLCAVHLDECGDVVATDSYRMYVQHGAYSGESIDLPAEVVREVAKCKTAKNPTAIITIDDETVVVKMADGKKIKGELPYGKYPAYKKLLTTEEPTTTATFTKERAKVLGSIAKQHAHGDRPCVYLDVLEGKVRLGGDGKEVSPCIEQGDTPTTGTPMRIGFNPNYLIEALTIADEVEVRLYGQLKAATFAAEGGIEVVVMPTKLSNDELPKRTPKGEKPKPEPTITPTPTTGALNLSGEVVCVTGTLRTMTRDMAFSRLKEHGGIPAERFTSKVTMLVIADAAGRDKRRKAEAAIAKGQKVKIVSGEEFERALKAAPKAAEPKPEPKPTAAPPKPKATPKPPKAKKPTRKEQEMADNKRIKELEKKLAALEAKLREAEARAAKAEKPAPEPPKAEHIATVVTLAFMQEWCKGKGLIATQKHDGACIWVEGESTPYKEELAGMGLRFARKRKSWYYPAQ